jgi:hypothetical protein
MMGSDRRDGMGREVRGKEKGKMRGRVIFLPSETANPWMKPYNVSLRPRMRLPIPTILPNYPLLAVPSK